MAQGICQAFSSMNLSDPNTSATSAVMRPGTVVRLRTSCHRYLRLAPKEVGLGGLGPLTHMRLHEGPGGSVKFESMMHPGVYLNIKDDGNMGIGAGHAKCEFMVKVKGKGVIVLERRDGLGRIGVTPDGKLKNAKQVGEGPHAQLIVEGVVAPERIGLTAGAMVRLFHRASNGYLRTAEGVVDCKGKAAGPLPWYRVNIEAGNVTFQNNKNNTFLNCAPDGRCMPTPTPGFFSVFFAPHDQSVGLISNTPPHVQSPAFDGHGVAQPTGAAPVPHGLFTLEAPIEPELLGIPEQHKFRLRAHGGSHLRITDTKTVDFSGGEGPSPWIKLRRSGVAGAAPLSIELESIKMQRCLRATPDGNGIDGDGGKGGPNAALQLISVAPGKVAIRTIAGLVSEKAPVKTAPLDEWAMFTLEL